MTLDSVGLILSAVTLLLGGVGAIAFIAARPTRREMNDAIQASTQSIAADLAYIRKRIDDFTLRKKP